MTAAPAQPDPHPHELTFLVYGTPAPQGSKRHVGRGVLVESNAPALRTWREDVKHAALDALEDAPGWECTYPVIVAHMTFVLPRPKNHYRTGKHAAELRPDAPWLHGKKPDLDKLLRSTFDALTTAGAYTDDSRVASVVATKTYLVSPGGPYDLDVPGARIHLQGSRG